VAKQRIVSVPSAETVTVACGPEVTCREPPFTEQLIDSIPLSGVASEAFTVTL
jgi:hypothetical protein